MKTGQLARQTRSLPSLFEDIFEPLMKLPFTNLRGDGGSLLSVPSVNITDTRDNYKISMAVPGLKKEDLKIDLEGNLLTISAQSEEQKEENEGRYTRQEYNYSSFSRSFTLPEDVKRENLQAKYENGILNILLPKKEESVRASETKHIDVQ